MCTSYWVHRCTAPRFFSFRAATVSRRSHRFHCNAICSAGRQGVTCPTNRRRRLRAKGQPDTKIGETKTGVLHVERRYRRSFRYWRLGKFEVTLISPHAQLLNKTVTEPSRPASALCQNTLNPYDMVSW